MNTTDTITTFSAWLRTGRSSWRRVASGPVEADVRRQLDAEAARHTHADTLVTADSRDPNDRGRRR